MFCVRVRKVKKHNKDTATIFFDRNLRSYPGQFIMLNVFGYEEIPLSLSSPNSVTARAVGETTSALIDIEVGELLGIKGPMGRPFSPADGKAMLIGGGIGIAPLIYLNSYLAEKGVEVHLLYGERTSENIIETENFRNVRISTDDGSAGFHGSVLELLKEEKNLKEFSRIYCCGPEKMLENLHKHFRELNILDRVEFALERYMKCGIGICGSCALNNGMMVCTDGPVFSASEVEW